MDARAWRIHPPGACAVTCGVVTCQLGCSRRPRRASSINSKSKSYWAPPHYLNFSSEAEQSGAARVTPDQIILPGCTVLSSGRGARFFFHPNKVQSHSYRFTAERRWSLLGTVARYGARRCHRSIHGHKPPGADRGHDDALTCTGTHALLPLSLTPC